mgnify:CR=1 FL=1
MNVTKKLYRFSDGSVMGHYPDTAGWSFGRPGACYDDDAHVSYPWHDPIVPSQVKDRCVRCGAVRPSEAARQRIIAGMKVAARRSAWESDMIAAARREGDTVFFLGDVAETYIGGRMLGTFENG